MPISILIAPSGPSDLTLRYRFHCSNKKRLAFSVATLSAQTFALAGDGVFGTKTSPVSTTGADTSMGAIPIAQMLVALLVVLALLKWLLPLAMKKANRKTAISGQGINVFETAVVGAGNLYVVEVRGKTLLLGATPNAISCLADLSPTQSTSELPTFQELVDQAGAVPMSTQKSAMDDLVSQLERLKTFEL